MDITDEIMGGASPFLSELRYDVIARELVMIAVDSPETMNAVKQIVFPAITNYSEEVDLDELDDLLIESVIGIHWSGDKEICLKTDTREIVVKLEGEPHAEIIT